MNFFLNRGKIALVLFLIAFLPVLTTQCFGEDPDDTSPDAKYKEITSVRNYLFGNAVLSGETHLFPDQNETDSDRQRDLYLIGKLLSRRVPPKDWKKHLGWTWPDGKPPPDAPLVPLVNFWTGYMEQKPDGPMPPAVRKRLFDLWEKNRKITGTGRWLFQPTQTFLDHLPKKQEIYKRVKQLLDQMPLTSYQEKESTENVKKWLMANSRYFRDELIQRSQSRVKALSRHPDSVYWESDPLTLLIRRDPEKAYQILSSVRLEPQEKSNLLLTGMRYEVARKLGNQKELETYRDRLRHQFLHVKLRKSRIAARYLFQHPWKRREEFFRQLLTNEKYERAAIALDERPVQVVPVLADVLHGDSRDVRYAAQTFLVENVVPMSDSEQKHAGGAEGGFLGGAFEEDGHSVTAQIPPDLFRTLLRASLPWLKTPDRGSKKLWKSFLKKFTTIKVPHAFDHLVRLLNHEDPEVRIHATTALGLLREKRVVDPLRQALHKTTENKKLRSYLLVALAGCGGITEKLWKKSILYKIETDAGKNAEKTGENGYLEGISDRSEKKQFHPLAELAKVYSRPDARSGVRGGVFGTRERRESLIPFSHISIPNRFMQGLIETYHDIKREKPATAQQLRTWISTRNLPASNRFLAEEMGKGWLTEKTLIRALERRDKIIHHAEEELKKHVQKEGLTGGVFTVLLNDRKNARRILRDGNVPTKLALLACARYVRMELPVDEVIECLKSDDRKLRVAADQYLDTLNTREARRALWKFYGNAIRVLGSTTYGMARPGLEDLKSRYKSKEGNERILNLKKRVQKHPDLHDIYVGSFSGKIIIVEEWDDRVQLKEVDDQRTYTDTDISGEAFNQFKKFIQANDIDALPRLIVPILDGEMATYLHVTRDRGRGMYLHNPGKYESRGTVYHMLKGHFLNLLSQADLKVTYEARKHLDGFEVLYSAYDKTLGLENDGNKLKVLIHDRNGERETRFLSDGKLVQPERNSDRSGSSDQSGTSETIDHVYTVKRYEEQPEKPVGIYELQYRSKSRGKEEESFLEGTLRPRENKTPLSTSLIKQGNYEKILHVTSDHQWIIAERKSDKAEIFERIHVPTGNTHRIKQPELNRKYSRMKVYDFISGTGYILIHLIDYTKDEDGECCTKKLLLMVNPKTGKLETFSENFDSILAYKQTHLQPSSEDHRYWVANSHYGRGDESGKTEIGRYSTNRFSFEKVMDVPHLTFDSNDMWVDEQNGEVYVAYEHDLLKFDLPEGWDQ